MVFGQVSFGQTTEHAAILLGSIAVILTIALIFGRRVARIVMLVGVGALALQPIVIAFL